jgi:hypothetical protein
MRVSVTGSPHAHYVKPECRGITVTVLRTFFTTPHKNQTERKQYYRYSRQKPFFLHFSLRLKFPYLLSYAGQQSTIVNPPQRVPQQSRGKSGEIHETCGTSQTSLFTIAPIYDIHAGSIFVTVPVLCHDTMRGTGKRIAGTAVGTLFTVRCPGDFTAATTVLLTTEKHKH